jgi:serine/threonine-protein kinase
MQGAEEAALPEAELIESKPPPPMQPAPSAEDGGELFAEQIWSSEDLAPSGEALVPEEFIGPDGTPVKPIPALRVSIPPPSKVGGPASLIGVMLRGRFRIDKKLGVGAQAQVFLARDVVLDRPVAIKVLNESVAAEEAGLERFLAEARIAARIRHQGCLAIYDFGEEHGLTFMAMEYFEGGTLAARIKQSGALDLSAVLHVMTEVTGALGAAHAEGIVHRDVKPSNILLDAAGRVRLTDFGVATNLLSNSTPPGLMVGTLAYMSPEQARGGVVDHRSDIFALGATLFEMLTSKPPFESTIDSLIARVNAPPPALPPELDVPAGLRTILDRALQPNPARRYASTRELQDELRSASVEITNTVQHSDDIPIETDAG